MPKISSQQVTVEIDGIRQHFSVQVFYNSDYGFYIQVPDQFHESFDQLSDADKKKFCAAIRYARKWEQGKQTRVVQSETEDGAVGAIKKLISRLVSLDIKKEAVILISFNDESSQTFGSHCDSNADLSRTGLSLAAIYCTKVSTSGTEPKYYTFRTHDWFGKTETTRSETGWRKQDQIEIPDTPENRKFIEDLHGALGTLLTKFKEFTASPESVLSFIAGSQKLLTNDAI